MDSAGLGFIMNQKVSAESGHRKFLLAGVNSRIAALFELTEVTGILRIDRTPEPAEQAAYTDGVRPLD